VNGEFSMSSHVDRETSLTQLIHSEVAVMDTGERVAIVQTPRDEVLLILLNGGDKSTQARDITTAKRLAKEAKDGIEGSSL
jgi:hypothetical protein